MRGLAGSRGFLACCGLFRGFASAQADGAAAPTSLTPSSGHSGDANATARCRSARYSGVVPVGDLGGKPCVIQLVTTRPAAALWQTEYPPARTEACEKCRQWRRSFYTTAGMTLDCADRHAKARSYSRDPNIENARALLALTHNQLMAKLYVWLLALDLEVVLPIALP
jgi:hypothetical protein